MTLYFDAFQVILLFVAVLLVCPSPSATCRHRLTLAGQLSHRRWKVALAGGRIVNDDVPHHSRGRLVLPLQDGAQRIGQSAMIILVGAG